MFDLKSAYPTRLLVYCPVCAAVREVDRADWIKHHTCCEADLTEMIVRAVATGNLSGQMFQLDSLVTRGREPILS